MYDSITLKLCLAIASVCTLVKGELRLTVVHTNDMHSRIDETNAQSAKCVGDSSKCYGGFARVKKAVEDVKANSAREGRETIFLNAGDTYQGTAYYTIYKWTVLAPLIDKLGIDVMSLGNHELDDGPEGLAPYLLNITTPVIACNLDFSKEPILQNTGITPSLVIVKNGIEIGVIGYLTPETKFLSQTGNIIFRDEVECIREEARKLSERGVKIIFAVGHSGYNVDQKIAASVPEVDLVVGGHTNTFLYTGTPPDIEQPDGPYPKVVQQPSGKQVPVVQAYAYTKYLGVLHIDINDAGEVTSWNGNPILLNHRVQKDPTIEALVEEKKNEIKGKLTKQVGITKVLLEGGGICRIRECNLGNLVADSMIDYNTRMYVGPGWTNAAVAIVNGGSIRTSITLDDDGYVTYGDLLTTMPFENAIERVVVKGNDLMLALENSVARYSPENMPGAFLQYSGLRVVYNMSSPAKSRVVSAEVRCANCSVPTYYPLDASKSYSVLMSSYVASGGDGFEMFKDNALSRKVIGDSDSLLLQEYIQRFSPIYPGNEGRVTQVVNTGINPNAGHSIHNSYISFVVSVYVIIYSTL